MKNMEAAITNIERKERQSEMQRKRNAEQANLASAPASSSGQPDAVTPNVPFLEPENPPVPEPKTPPMAPPSQRSGQPDAGDQSWSWNRDHYGSRREWRKWQGAWYYRDDRRSRWIYWGR